jgi:hypothetical protein
MRYYHIVRLKRGCGIVFDGNDLRINLDAVGHGDHIFDDRGFVAAQHPDYYTYVSGGGTILINGRYLVVVRREQTALVNPGRLSLFTGRANGPDEWVQPRHVARELFEELVLFIDGNMLYPRCGDFQPVIDSVYRNAGRTHAEFDLQLQEILLPKGTIEVSRDGEAFAPLRAYYHVNSRNDINVLHLFEAELDMERLTASDGESEEDSTRSIAALDLETMTLRDLSDTAEQHDREDVTSSHMTEHLVAMVEMATAYLQFNKVESRYK